MRVNNVSLSFYIHLSPLLEVILYIGEAFAAFRMLHFIYKYTSSSPVNSTDFNLEAHLISINYRK